MPCLTMYSCIPELPPRFEIVTGDSLVVQRPEVEFGMKFLFEKLRATARVADVFAGLATCLQVQTYCSSLKRGSNRADALAVGMIQSLGDADQRSQPSG